MDRKILDYWMDDVDPLNAVDLQQLRVWSKVLDDNPARWLADQWWMRYSVLGPS